jgi:hypothetical protein
MLIEEEAMRMSSIDINESVEADEPSRRISNFQMKTMLSQGNFINFDNNLNSMKKRYCLCQREYDEGAVMI